MTAKTCPTCRTTFYPDDPARLDLPRPYQGWSFDLPECYLCYLYTMFGGLMEPAGGPDAHFEEIYGVGCPTIRGETWQQFPDDPPRRGLAMTAAAATLYARLTARGVRFDLGPAGVSVGPPARLTPADLAACREHKAALADILAAGKPPAVECRWATGFVGRHHTPENGWPVGAREWRFVGEGDWRPIPADAKREAVRPSWIADDATLEAAKAEWRAKKEAGTLDVRMASDEGELFTDAGKDGR